MAAGFFGALLISTSLAVTLGYDHHSAQIACQYLRVAAPNITLLPFDPEYANASTENWSATAWASPTCVIRPNDVQGLQKALVHLTSNHVKFAIRSGGHMPSPRAANIDDGLLFDLAALNNIRYDASSGTVTVGAGTRWGDIYRALDVFNVTVVGGRVLDVGVGGLTLGSGLSYLTDLYGLACDNVAEFEVLLANGTLVTADQERNEDLHWALKGGSNNFGIVTSFKLYTYPIHNVWGGIKTYSLENLPVLFAAVLEYQSKPSKDPYANFMLQAFITNASVGAVLNMVYLKPVEAPSAFAPFYNISTTGDTTKIRSLTDMMSGQVVPDIPRWDWFTTSFQPDNNLYQQVLEILTTAPELTDISSITSGSLALGLQPVSESAVRAGWARGRGNALNLQAVNQTWFVLDTGWNWAADDTVAHGATRAMMKRVREAAVQGGLDLPYLFMNDASYDQHVIASYGPGNVARLYNVQRKYDPYGVFQHLVPGGFKLP